MTARLRRDLAITAGALLLLLAWDWSGADLAAARLFGGPQGFTWRDTWWAARLLHDGGRLAAWGVLALLMVSALRTPQDARPGRAERWGWIGVMLTCVLLVPALKHVSATSCPWELAEFGGAARYVSHRAFGVFDGGPGHCFPSGHAVAAFAFFGAYFLWREHQPRRAHLWLAGVCVAGLLFGTAQLARGAHYPSHTLWSAWLCWALCVGAAAAQSARPSHARTPAQDPR